MAAEPRSSHSSPGAKTAPKPSVAQKGASDALGGGLGRVVIRNEFYRDGYRTMLRVALIEGIVILGLIVVILAVVAAYQPENRYFATTEDGRLVPMDIRTGFTYPR